MRRVAPLGVALLVAWSGVRPVAGQERGREREREGERCVCVRVGRPGVLFFGRGRLGVLLETEANPATDSIGARIQEVMPGSPAAEAGLRAGDILTALNGHSLREPVPGEVLRRGESAPAQRVILLLRDVEPGDTVRVEYRRGSERRTAQVVTRWGDEWVAGFGWPYAGMSGELLRYPRPPALRERLAEVVPAFGRGAVESRFGFQAVDLNPELGEYFGATEGALVVRVREGAPLAVRPGDVVLRVSGRAVRDAQHLRDILASYRRDEVVTLEVLRKRSRVTVEGRAR